MKKDTSTMSLRMGAKNFTQCETNSMQYDGERENGRVIVLHIM